MNVYRENLYNDLMSLVDSNEAFFFADRVLDDQTYRLFNYRLASYTDFLLPGAMECRGVMFNITDLKAVELVSLPMEKFFNLNENPMTMDLDLSTVVGAEYKADGSLISTYLHNKELRLKTKGSIESDQCIAAMKYLEQDEHADLKLALGVLAELGYTVNMEWCAPDNRIVLGYMEPVLTVLNVRRMHDGEYTDIFKPSAMGNPTFDPVREAWIDSVDVDHTFATWAEFIEDIPAMTGVEGFVILMESGQRVKIKTEWYLVQHRAKDSINYPRRLFEAVLAEATDDLRTLFHDDLLVIQRIEEMELFVEGKYNHLVDTVERFYERNKHMERKEYAILGQKELIKMHFGLAMSKYTGKEVKYKEFMAKKWKEFGLKDESELEE